MDLSKESLELVASTLQQTFSNERATRKNAEKLLSEWESTEGFVRLLIGLMRAEDVPMPVRISASVNLKNIIKRNWRVKRDCPDSMRMEDRVLIKELVVPMMLSSPVLLQKQMSDAISIIGAEDFPLKWPDLLDQLISRFQTGNFHEINGVLQTAHSLFKRYRHEFKSNELWTEIRYVLDVFASPFTNLFKVTVSATQEQLDSPQPNVEQLKALFQTLVLCSKVFYSLNYQDIPDFFEDHMADWMGPFLNFLMMQCDLMVTDTDDEPGVLEHLRSQVCENVGMYAQKYDEEFISFLPLFVNAIWRLLIATGKEPKYDILVSNAIKFSAHVAERASYKHLFADPTTLQSICEKVIIPNMAFRASDEELFEDNPEEFVRRDMEGSDFDTRRRSACDLVKSLSKTHEGPVIQNFAQYIQFMFQEYARDPVQHWRGEDVALYLITSLAAHCQTQRHGATATSSLVNISDVFYQHVFPLLQDADIDRLPVLKADALKYVVIFRSVLSPSILKELLPFIVTILPSKSPVVHTYAAHCIERIFLLRGTDKKPLITSDDLAPLSERLLDNLMSLLDRPGYSEENEYVMKAIMRTFLALQQKLLPFIEKFLGKITQKIVTVSKNPGKAQFNHYLFECLSLAIRITCKEMPDTVGQFEDSLFPTFQYILENDVQEFTPYAFQIMSLLLESRRELGGSMPPVYSQMFSHLLKPDLWERPANVPALVRLMQAVIAQGQGAVVTQDKLQPLLGVFQKLIAMKSSDHEGFYLLGTILKHLPQELLVPYERDIFLILFRRLSSSKTAKYATSFVVFLCLYASIRSPQQLISTVEGIQAKMWNMTVENLIVKDAQKVSGATEKKICAVGLTKILLHAPEYMVDGEFRSLWCPLLEVLVRLFELPEDESVPDEHFIDLEASTGYQAAFCELTFGGRRDEDPLSVIPNAKVFLAQSLNVFSSANTAKFQELSNGLSENIKNCLQVYLRAV